MKTPTLFRTLLLVLLLAAAGNGAMAQSDSCATNVIHTYMNGRPIPWDSVKVKVQDAPYHTHSFMLYWPDTLLSNCPTDVDEYALDKGAELSQVFPNPCAGTSQVKLTLRNSGIVSVSVMDLQGRLCCRKTLQLSSGKHLLSLKFPQSGFYFVQAESTQGSEVCKVLCTEGAGSDFDIRLTSTSFQSMEKAGKDSKGGEGQFSMTDKMQITAYITYNGSVLNSDPADINYDSILNGVEHSEWLYHNGSINIHFTETDTCDEFPLSGQICNIMVASGVCQPFADYPLGSRVTFYDTTFQALQGSHFQQLSSTWQFNGWYKYRYYPAIERFCVCGMDDPLPPENITSADDPALLNYDVRKFHVMTCDVATIGQCMTDTECYGEELMVNSHCDTSCYAYDLSESCCSWLTPHYFPDTLILVNDMQGVSHFIHCNCPTLPEIDLDCHSMVVVGGSVAGGIIYYLLDASITTQDDTYIITISYMNDDTDVNGSGYVRGVVINKIDNISDAHFQVVLTKKLWWVLDSFSSCQSDALPSDTVIFQTYGGPFNSFKIQHHLSLNCDATNVTIEAALNVNTNTVNIVYHVDGNVSNDCVCPSQIEYTIGEILPGNYNIILWMDNQIIHQEMYDFHW